jgi:hypothetical protein
MMHKGERLVSIGMGGVGGLAAMLATLFLTKRAKK